MTDNEIRIALATLTGWNGPFTEVDDDSIYAVAPGWENSIGVGGGPVNHLVPQLFDLNWLHEVTVKLFPNQVAPGFYHPLWQSFMDNLKIATGHSPDSWNEHDLFMANSHERAKAILVTFGKWNE